MKKPYRVKIDKGGYFALVWVLNSRNDVVAKCYSKSMAKRIAASLNKDAEVKRMIKEGVF